jgi:hypothetical protein
MKRYAGVTPHVEAISTVLWAERSEQAERVKLALSSTRSLGK